MKIVSFFYVVLILSNYVTTQYQYIEIWKRISKKIFYSLQVLYYKQELRKFRLESSGFSRMAMKKTCQFKGISFHFIWSLQKQSDQLWKITLPKKSHRFSRKTPVAMSF